jgi:hypothetical protein
MASPVPSETGHDHICQPLHSPNSSVGIVTGPRGRRPELQIFLLSTESRQALGPTQPPIQWFPAVMRPGRDANSSPLSNAEIENGGTIPPLVPYFSMASCLFTRTTLPLHVHNSFYLIHFYNKVFSLNYLRIIHV